ncbi:MAG TPA: TonB-dependent receptor [Holophagaceae bacterium]|nr:TonB-dependent receptor [Holophagaceae bacterium]
MARTLTRLGLLGLSLVAATALPAQGTQTGNLTGTVREGATGKPIPGAHVTVRTPQGDRTTTTNADGQFRFAQLIPGPVTLSVAAEGYVGGSIATRVPLGSTNVTDFPLSPLSVATTTVTVLGTANNIDTTDAKVGQNFTLSAINDLPIPATQRTVTNIAALAPGVSVDGNGGLTLRGSQSTQVLYVVDGVDVADPVTGGYSAQLNEDMLSEVQVLDGGISAEYGRFTGGVVQAVTKSGTNDFEGVVRFSFLNPDWAAYNPLNRGANGSVRFKDTTTVQQNVVVSGPIIKDHLFFVIGYRAQAPFARSATAQTTAPPAYGGGLPYNATQTDERKDIKLDWQITPAYRLFAQYNKTEIDQTGRDYATAFFGGSTSTATLSNQPNAFSYSAIGFQGQLSDNILLNLHYGKKDEQLGGPGGGGQGGPTVPTMVDLVSGYVFDNGFFGPDADYRPIRNASASLTWFVSALGDHEFKAGVDWYESSHNAANSQSPTNQIMYFDGFVNTVSPSDPTPLNGDTSLANRNFDANSYLSVFIPYTGTAKNTIWSGYLNDKWKLNGHWSFNLGLRVDKNVSKSDIQATNYDVTAYSPRLAAIWDLRGDGAWVLQASYGVYTGQVIQGATDGASTVGNPAEYDYAYVGGPGDQRSSYGTTPIYVLDAGLYRNSNLIDPNLKMPEMDEIAVSVKHADGHDGIWSATLNRRKWRNFVDDFKDVQPNPVDANDQSLTIYRNDPSLVRDYLGLDLQYQKQFTEAFSLGGNVTLSQLNGNYEGGQVGATEQWNNFGPEGAYAGQPTAAQLGHTYGPLTADVPLRIRVFSNYTRLLGRGRLNVGAIFQYTSGAPYNKTALSTNLTPQLRAIGGNSYTEFFADRGAFRFPDFYRTDLQVAYDLKIWRRINWFLSVNLQNVFNHQQLVTWNTSASVSGAGAWTPGSSYGRPTSSGNYLAGRTLTFSTGFKF